MKRGGEQRLPRVERYSFDPIRLALELCVVEGVGVIYVSVNARANGAGTTISLQGRHFGFDVPL